MKKIKKTKQKVVLKAKTDVDKDLGAAHREAYLQKNPHGYRRVKKVHKNKKKYCRKRAKQQASY